MKLGAAIIAAVLFVLMPLAHGSPIDPSIPGFWDNGDFDDVILILTSNLHVVESDDPTLLRRPERASETVRDRPAGTATQSVDAPGVPRSPPVA